MSARIWSATITSGNAVYGFSCLSELAAYRFAARADLGALVKVEALGVAPEDRDAFKGGVYSCRDIFGKPRRRSRRLIIGRPAPGPGRRMTDIQECRRRNGSGEIAISTVTCRFIAPGPVPEDAKGVAVAGCDECFGMGYVESGGQS